MAEPKPRNRNPLVVVVPCRDEEAGIEPLVAALVVWSRAESALRPLDLVFVDDGSTDRTGERLAAAVAAAGPGDPVLSRARIVRHDAPRGLTAALWTGLASAPDVDDPKVESLVAWLDADLTYPPDLLGRLAACCDDGADVALASPYHPAGGVEGVPAWRLALSRAASLLWRLAVRATPRASSSRVHTFTSMVRVWRRPWLERCRPVRGGFLGVTESLVRALKAGARVAEVPAVLRRRRTGQSKMRIARVALGQLGLVASACCGGLRERRSA
jgi:dolichol-phosphate mannosyltransferase